MKALKKYDAEILDNMYSPARIEVMKKVVKKIGFVPDVLSINGNGFTLSYENVPSLLSKFRLPRHGVAYSETSWVFQLGSEVVSGKVTRRASILPDIAQRLARKLERKLNYDYDVGVYMGSQEIPKLNIVFKPKFKYFGLKGR